MRIKTAYLIALFLLLACRDQQKNDLSEKDHVHAPAETYTCPMHPQIVQQQPGTCPVCGMELVRVTSSRDSLSSVMLTDTQMRLGNITTQPVSKRPVGQTVITNGVLTVDEEHSQFVSSRAAGRIERLYVKETGRAVFKGEPLYVLYSETLLILQQEYLMAKEQFEKLGTAEIRYKSFLEAAERKLLLYGLTKTQIAGLQDRRAIQPRVTILSPASGVVTDIKFSEGQYVPEGGVIYRLEDINTLWVEADLYPDEASLVETGDKITVRVTGFESLPIEATVTFISPEYRGNSQVTVMRAEIENHDLQFKPGQQVQVFFTNSSREAVALPLDAVIRSERGTHVYVRAGMNSFQPRMVTTGLEGPDYVEITGGLHERDTVAVTGAYLLYSEIILKKGSDPMAGHNH